MVLTSIIQEKQRRARYLTPVRKKEANAVRSLQVRRKMMEKYFKRVGPAETGNSGQRMAHSSHVRPMAAAPMEAQSHAGMRRRLRGIP